MIRFPPRGNLGFMPAQVAGFTLTAPPGVISVYLGYMHCWGGETRGSQNPPSRDVADNDNRIDAIGPTGRTAVGTRAPRLRMTECLNIDFISGEVRRKAGPKATRTTDANSGTVNLGKVGNRDNQARWRKIAARRALNRSIHP
jgi:hypothetical protein